MKKNLVTLLIIAIVLVCSVSTSAREIKLAVGMSLPPYIISDNNSGFELEIVKAILESKGYTVKIQYLPFARIPEALQRGTVDGAFPINEASGMRHVKYSDSHIAYQNIAVSLKSNNFNVNSIEDLKNYPVVAFQNATLYLGDEFKNVVKQNPDYSEQAEQELQIAMVYKRKHVAVMDINIFKYYREHTKKVDTSADVILHEIFPKTPYKVGFLDEDVKTDFNAGLKEIKASGKYDTIIKKYVK